MSDNNNYFAPLSPQSMEFMNLLEKQLAQQSQQDSSPSHNSNSNNMFNNGITPSPNQSSSNYGFNANGGRSQSQSQSPLSDYTSNPFGSAAFSSNNPSRSNSNGFNAGAGVNNQAQMQTPGGVDLATLLPLLQANGFGGMLAGLNGGGNQNQAGMGRGFGQSQGQAGGNMYSNGNGNGYGNQNQNQASNGFNASMTGNNNNGQMVLTPQMLNALVAGLAAQQQNNAGNNGNGAVNPLLAMGFGAASGNGSGFVSGGVNAFAPAVNNNAATVNPTGPAWNPYPQPGVHTPEGSSGKESSPSNGSSPEADMSGQNGHQGPSRQTSTSSNLQGSNNSQRQASTGSTSSNHNNGTSSRMTSPPLNPVIDELKHGRATTTPAKQAAASGSTGNAAAGSSASSRRGSQSGRARGAKNDAAGADAHKRKAEGDELGGHDAHRRHLDGQSDDETSDDDHMTGTGRKPKKTSGRRKSSGAGADDQTPESKALKRKNQNRAAQKAFRERREARVKDLEDKVAELESKNAGQAFENENLRQMLSKLQKENMQFKNTGDFTFTMPLPDREAAADQSIQSDKLPSPPLSLVVSRGEEAAESSRARRDNSTPGASSHAGASSYDSPSSGMGDQSSPDALNSASASTNGPALFNPEPYNAFIPNNNGFSKLASAPAAYSPFAAAAENLQALSSSDIQQLLMAFRDQQQAMGQTTGATPQFSGYREGNIPAVMEADAAINETDINDIFGDEDAMNAFLRSLSQPEESAAEVDVLDTLPAPPAEPSIAPWTPANPNAPAGMSYGSDLFGSYMLRGFKGTPNGFPDTNAKAGKKESGSASNASANMDTSFSPSNYLTTSPDPMGPASTSAEGAKKETETCPFGHALKTGVMPTDGDLTFNVKGEDGQMMTSQELWTNLQSKVDLSSGFDLDDLCDNFKAKAKCDGTGPVISKVEVDKILSEYSAKRNASSTLI